VRVIYQSEYAFQKHTVGNVQ